MCRVTLASYLWIKRGFWGSLVTGYLCKQRELPRACQRWAHWICVMLQKDRWPWNEQGSNWYGLGNGRKQFLFLPSEPALLHFTFCQNHAVFSLRHMSAPSSLLSVFMLLELCFVYLLQKALPFLRCHTAATKILSFFCMLFSSTVLLDILFYTWLWDLPAFITE